MVRVNSTIRLNSGMIRQLDQIGKLALTQTADAIMTDVKTRQIMPFKTGNLQNESTFIDDSEVNRGKVSIVSSTPYARRLYFHPEYHFSKAENPNAGGEWFKDYLEGGSRENFAEETFTAIYQRLLR
ncbi:MAG: hypothetical protein ACI4C1_08635 [Lachnospiraceae bacterium]